MSFFAKFLSLYRGISFVETVVLRAPNASKTKIFRALPGPAGGAYSAPPNPLAGLGYDVRHREYFENSAPKEQPGHTEYQLNKPLCLVRLYTMYAVLPMMNQVNKLNFGPAGRENKIVRQLQVGKYIRKTNTLLKLVEQLTLNIHKLIHVSRYILYCVYFK